MARAAANDEDLFGSALTLEEDHIHEGYEQGLRDGRATGRQEGRALGLQKGFEVGHEVGYYKGCLSAWRQLQARAGGEQLVGERAARRLAALEAQLAAFPLQNPQDERLQELMDALRGRFRAVVAALALPPDACPSPGVQAQQGQQGQQF